MKVKVLGDRLPVGNRYVQPGGIVDLPETEAIAMIGVGRCEAVTDSKETKKKAKKKGKKKGKYKTRDMEAEK